MTTLRDTVMALPADERLEYALGCWEMLTGQDDAPPLVVGGVKLTAMQATVFALLKRRAGNVVSLEAIMAVLDANKADADATPNLVRVHILQLRKKLTGQFNIITAWGQGYVLEAVA